MKLYDLWNLLKLIHYKQLQQNNKTGNEIVVIKWHFHKLSWVNLSIDLPIKEYNNIGSSGIKYLAKMELPNTKIDLSE